MKEIYFYALFAIIAALQSALILGGFLSPLFSYTPNNILFSLCVIAVVMYMGWSLAKLGLKKVAIKGAIAALVSYLVISLAAVVGYLITRPVLGIQLLSIYYLPIPLLVMTFLNVVLYAFFAALGALLAQNIKPSKKSKRKK
jgi:hypothetical protein